MSAHEAGRAKPLTVEEFQRLPEDAFYRYELVGGWLVREPRPLDVHGWLVMRLGARLHAVVERTRAGYLVTESGFILQEQPPTVRGPDLAFIARERVTEFPVHGYHRFGPDLAVEVLSPSDRAADMQRKVEEYFRAGSRLVWLVDPRARTIVVHRSNRDAMVLRAGEVLTGGDVLAGFRLPVSELFDA